MGTYSRIGRSASGGLIRSPSGYLCLGSEKSRLEADGEGTAQGVFTRALFTFGGGTSDRSLRVDSPMGTQVGTITNIAGFGGATTTKGKTKGASPPGLTRIRGGVSWALASSYAGATSAVIKVVMGGSVVEESLFPLVYLSSSDDSGLYTPSGTTSKSNWDWENHLDTQLTTAFGPLDISSSATQELIIPFSAINAALGTHISVVLCGSSEVFGSGTYANSTWQPNTFALEIR